MVKSTKFYDILEVSPTASQAEIKKAYHKLAKEKHPDKGGDPEVFKAILKAHEVLKDPEQREVYDRYGEEGLEEGGGGHHSHADILSHLFGGGGGMFGGGGGRPRGPQKGEDVEHGIGVTLENLYCGKQSKMAITRKAKCSKCDGSGSKKKGENVTCQGCKGRGVRLITRQMGMMIQQMQAVCPDCNGEGTSISEKDRCGDCKGKKLVSEKKTVELNVDPGMRHGQRVTFSGLADDVIGGLAGDVIMVLQQKEHARFVRKGNDLLITHKIQLVEALCGTHFVIQHLDERPIFIKTTPGHIIKPGDVMSVKGEGMPIYKNPFEKGDLYIKFEVTFPDSIPVPHATTLKTILPPGPKVQAHPEAEEHFLQPSDLSNLGQSAHSTHRSAHDDDDDDEDGHGGQRVQCGQQ